MALVARVLGALPPAPAESADGAGERARQILARPEFRPPVRSPLQVVLDALGRMVARVLSGLGGAGPVAGWIAVTVVTAVLVVVVVRAARALQSGGPRVDGVAIDDVGRPAADWRAEAAAHEAAAEHRLALRCRWRALVADLAARGLVDEVPGRTTGAYRQAVGRSVPDAAQSFADATDLFERAWYGAVDVGPDDVDAERRLGDRVLAAARR